MNPKQILNSKVKELAVQLYRGLVSPDQYDKVTWELVKTHLPEHAYSRDLDTNVITLNISLKGIRKFVKKNPSGDVVALAKHFDLPHEVYNVVDS